MSVEFYGAKAEAQERVNRLLRLFATGQEQDWEIEFADVSRIDEMLNILELENLDFDSRCALALLIICSIDEADDVAALEPAVINRVARLLAANENVRIRMEFFWVELGRANNMGLVKRLVSG